MVLELEQALAQVRAFELILGLGLVMVAVLELARMQVIAMALMQVRTMALMLWRTTVSIRMAATALGMSPRRLLTRRQAIPRMATLCP